MQTPNQIRKNSVYLTKVEKIRNQIPRDWKPDDGIIGQMLSYRNWWNIPTRKASDRSRPKP
jgi:hypothetical protein